MATYYFGFESRAPDYTLVSVWIRIMLRLAFAFFFFLRVSSF